MPFPFTTDMAPLDVPEDAAISQEIEGSKCLHLFYIIIEPTDSTEWGTPAEAMQRALKETTVTEENKRLIRTHHPAFANTGPEDVAISYCCSMWAVSSTNVRILETHAGGIPIRYRPSPKNYPRIIYLHTCVCPSRQIDICHPLDPRGILSEFHLWALQQTYPLSCGVRLWLNGTLEILSSNKRHVDEERRKCRNVTYQTPVYEVLDCRPTKLSSSSGKKGQIETTTLQLPDGTRVRTVPTHTFVRLPGHSLGGRPADFALGGIDALLGYCSKPPPYKADGKPYVWTKDRPPTSNTPLGRRVSLAEGDKGRTITHTFDSPSIVREYPWGYKHDLSFVAENEDGDTAKHGDKTDSHMGLPRINGWANITDALAEDADLFVITHTGETEDKFTDDKSSSKPVKTRKAMAEGMQYLWDRKTKQQSAALLWRVAPEIPDLGKDATPADIKAAVDASTTPPDVAGQALYLGNLTDKTAKIVVFQNFDAVCNTGVSKYLGMDKNNIKGGFMLPSFVYKGCKIVQD